MFKNILVPTDGSVLSQETARQAVAFARSIGARITAYHAKPNLAANLYGEEDQTSADSMKDIDAQIDREVRKNLDYIEVLCREAGVACEPLSTTSNSPYEAIVEAAARANADLIFMASHGKKGFKARLIGSETQRVLTHSPIPVLVYRWGEAA